MGEGVDAKHVNGPSATQSKANDDFPPHPIPKIPEKIPTRL